MQAERSRAELRRALVRAIASAAAILAVASIANIAAGAPDMRAPAMLPAGFLSTRGNQIVDRHGRPVRIACVGGMGTVVDSDHLDYNFGPHKDLDSNIAAMKQVGFNCIRADFNDRCVNHASLMADFDQLVATCKKYGLKVIFCHHNDEATPADWGNAAQQTNGLWYDSGPGTDGTDGAGDKGTVTNEVFTQDWVKLAKRYAGNDTVIGFDLDNEPHIGYGTPYNGENWGDGGPGDICAMYTNVGNAIQAVDPGALIICEGLMDNTDKSSITWWMMDLSHAAAKPVVLRIPHKVVYSVHEYPNAPHDSGPAYVARMNADWGYLVKQNIAPVWIGEMGASLDAADGGGSITLTDEKAWADTLLSYMNGTAPDAPRFKKGEQPISGDWWNWGCRTGESPDGCLEPDGTMRPGQAVYIEQMLYRPK